MFDFTGDKYWQDKALSIKQAMYAFLWDEDLGYFCDFDSLLRGKKRFLSPAGTVYPLWAGICTDKDDVKKRVRDTLVIYLEGKGGIVGSECLNWKQTLSRQWDFPFGWAPHQILAWIGLKNNGFEKDSKRIAFRWLATLSKVYSKYKCVPEKVDVITQFDPVETGMNIEYGTQCSKHGEFFGWSMSSVVIGLKYIGESERILLNGFGQSTDKNAKSIACNDDIDSCLLLIMKSEENKNSADHTWSTAGDEMEHFNNLFCKNTSL
jgi:alpha,alpha-trehalase